MQTEAAEEQDPVGAAVTDLNRFSQGLSYLIDATKSGNELALIDAFALGTLPKSIQPERDIKMFETMFPAIGIENPTEKQKVKLRT